MPEFQTVYEWLYMYPEFDEAYTRAKTRQMQVMIEETLEIADNGQRDYKIGENGIVADHDHISRAKLRVETRKWIASKLAPKIYGDSTILRGDKDNPIALQALSSALDDRVRKRLEKQNTIEHKQD